MHGYELAIAADEDVDDVIAMVLEHLGRSPHRNHPNIFKIEAVILTLMSVPDGLVLLVKRDGQNVGLLLAKAEELMFSDDRLAMEIALYTRPGNPRALQMLRHAYEWWAANKQRAFGASLSSMPNENSDRLDNVYLRWGYEPVEKTFIKRF